MRCIADIRIEARSGSQFGNHVGLINQHRAIGTIQHAVGNGAQIGVAVLEHHMDITVAVQRHRAGTVPVSADTAKGLSRSDNLRERAVILGEETVVGPDIHIIGVIKLDERMSVITDNGNFRYVGNRTQRRGRAILRCQRRVKLQQKHITGVQAK